MKMIEIRI